MNDDSNVDIQSSDVQSSDIQNTNDQNTVDNNTNTKPMTKKEKAEAAGTDIAEVATRGAARYYGGELGGAAVDMALNTKAGQRTIQKAGKRISRIPIVRGRLAKNQEQISEAKPMINSMIGSNGTNSQDVGEKKSDDLINSNNENVDNSNTSDDNKNDVSGKSSNFISNLWKKSSFKTKLIFIGVIGSFFLNIVFICIMISPLISLGIIDISGLGNVFGSSSGGYSSVSTNVTHWIPIGSSTTTERNGVLFATASPQVNIITSSFASQEDFRTSKHGGIDFGNGGNGPGIINIIATKSGTVIYPESTSQTSYNDNGYYGNPDGGGFGNYVMIQHSDQTITVYAHLAKDSITVFSGQSVSQGQVIGKMGHSGSSTGTHLHFEVRLNGVKQNPLNYVNSSIPRP